MDALGVTTMFTTDTDLQIFPYRTSFLSCNLHQTTDTIGVNAGEWIVFEQAIRDDEAGKLVMWAWQLALLCDQGAD